jgi:hypothetical protein
MMAEASLPLLYGPWLRDVAGGAIPKETIATCDRCVMLKPSEGAEDATYFHPAVKCCTFQPNIPNFLAGRILSDADPSIAGGRAALEQRIARRVAVTPSHVGAGAVFGLLYKSTPNAFGRAPALRCSYLTPEGGCGVWKYRPGVCATWFCKHVRGQTGRRFWQLADKLLREVELELALHCLAEMKVGSAEVGDVTARPGPDVSELDGEIDWAAYRRLWGEWAGRETDFYRACARLVEGLAWEDVVEACGPRVRILADLVRDARAHLASEAIPERLRVRDFKVDGFEKGRYRVTTYSEFDPVLLSDRLTRVLRYFDGRPTDDALAAIFEEEGVRLAPSLLRRMVDFGILGAAGDKRALPVVG